MKGLLNIDRGADTARVNMIHNSFGEGGYGAVNFDEGSGEY